MKFAALLLLSASLSSLACAGKNPSDYPLHLRVVDAHWNLRGQEYEGWGRANLIDGSSLRGLDYSYRCTFNIKRTLAQNEAYAAKWKKDQLELEVLAAEMGKVDKYMECELKTKVRSDIWVDGPGGLHTISQDQYQAMLANRGKPDASTENKLAGEKSVSPQPLASTSSQTGSLRLAVTSTPGGADIEVDGNFMGSTPSSIELSPGDHNVSVRKAGYKPWERKLKLTGGDITLSADLDRDPAAQ